MPNRNSQTVIGHLGRDPELRYMANGDAVCNLTVASTEKWKDKSGEWKEQTEWVKCTVFRELGSIVGEEFRKGDAIHVEGKSKTRKWQDKDGNDRYSTELVADYVARPIYVRKERQEAPKPSGGFAADMDEDIPFMRIGRVAAMFA